MMKIRVCNISSNSLPYYATDGASGMDLKAFLKDEKISFIHPMERKIIKTGLFLEIPIGFEGQIRPRSGLALNYGITVLNNPGTIDSDYRGEIKILLINLSNFIFVVKNGDRIAQIIFFHYEKIEFEKIRK